MTGLGVFTIPVLAWMLLAPAACKNAEGEDTKKADPPVSIQSELIVTQEATVSIGATGTMEARSDVAVVTEAAGKITHVYFELGDDVEEGQKLVKLDRKLQKLAVKQAQAQLQQAKAAEELASISQGRLQSLFDKGSASQAELDEVSMQAKSAKAARDMASVMLSQARYALTKTTVTSPIAGRVTFKMVTKGQTMGLGSPVAQVTDLSSLKVTVGLTEREVSDLVVDQQVLVTSAVNEDVRSTGRIAAIGYKAVGPTRAFPVEIWIEEPDARLHPGMTVEIEILVATLPEAILVHVNDVYEEDGQSFVWVTDSGKAKRVQIETGRTIDERIIVLSGLQGGERVVVNGGDLLREGAAVLDTTPTGKQP